MASGGSQDRVPRTPQARTDRIPRTPAAFHVPGLASRIPRTPTPTQPLPIPPLRGAQVPDLGNREAQVPDADSGCEQGSQGVSSMCRHLSFRHDLEDHVAVDRGRSRSPAAVVVDLTGSWPPDAVGSRSSWQQRLRWLNAEIENLYGDPERREAPRLRIELDEAQDRIEAQEKRLEGHMQTIAQLATQVEQLKAQVEQFGLRWK